MERMIVCGGGHIASFLVPMAKMLDWNVMVVEDREEFCNQERFPDCELKLGDYQQVLESVVPTENDHVVIVTRGHKGDRCCLAWALERAKGYVGMIGSRAKIARLWADLKAQGVSDQALSSVHAPIGLKIGAQTPAEIAVAIVAEIIDWRYAHGATAPSLPDQPCNLAMITAKRGSAPRGVGAWMALTDQGKFLGTVGGGAVEAEVERKLKEGKIVEPFTLTYDLSLDAGRLGMACGGTVEITFSRIEGTTTTDSTD